MKDPELYQRLISRMRVDEKTGCWLWTGPYHHQRKWPQNRYGYISIWRPDRGRSISYGTHRAMLMALHGPLTKQQCACHRCDVPLCINPEHLFIGTMGDNIRDSRSKNRHHEAKKNYCDRGHPLFGDNVRVERQHPPKMGIRRSCKACELGRLRLRAGWPADLAFDMTIKIPSGYCLDFETRTLVSVKARAAKKSRHHSASREP